MMSGPISGAVVGQVVGKVSDTVSGLRQRLQWDAEQGTVHDGPRRYLLMRPDVLMGAIAALDAPLRAAVLEALAQSTQQHGARSLQAYAEQAPGDDVALIAATVQAAAELGWGRWVIRREGQQSLTLEVSDSPFVAGWRAATQSDVDAASDGVLGDPICAPIRGMFSALAEIVLKAPVQAQECHCAADDEASVCRFVARIQA